MLWTSLKSIPVWTSGISCHKMGKSVTCVIAPGVRTVSRESELQDSPGSCRHKDKKPTEKRCERGLEPQQRPGSP